MKKIEVIAHLVKNREETIVVGTPANKPEDTTVIALIKKGTSKLIGIQHILPFFETQSKHYKDKDNN